MRRFLLAALLAGCFESHAPPCTVACSTDDECPSGLACNGTTCSVGGEACAAAVCDTPGVRRCATADSPALEVCGETGTWTTETTCPASCVADATPHCGYLEPQTAALAAICDVPATSIELVIDSMTMLSTDSGACTSVIPQVLGPAICVVRAPRITILGPGGLRAMGSRALALIADHDLVVEGTIDVSASGRADGPGGGTRTSGQAAASALGGSGAGFQIAGANGGSLSGAPNAGGPPGENAATATALAGGYRAAGAISGGDKSGGGGGGALALISCNGAVSISGILDAGGGGGLGGLATLIDSGLKSGAGGGSGGVLLLQGMRVSITASAGVYANGGGGGGGGTGMVGADGSPGGRSVTSGGDGGPGVGQGGDGGRGGYVQDAPAAGAGGSGSSGGGGGSVGYIIVSTPNGTAAVVDANAAVSPSATRTLATLR